MNKMIENDYLIFLVEVGGLQWKARTQLEGVV